MKYIIIPILKFIYAVIITVLYSICIIVGEAIHFLWAFKFICDWKDTWAHDPQPHWYKDTSLYKKELVYKTVWHWLFNGNFKNFD